MPSALRGNTALIGRSDLFKVDPKQIIVRDGWNPRTQFDISDLKNSIREHGVLVPLRVRIQGDTVELVDGERRLRATLALIEEGYEVLSVPAILEKAGADADLLVTALITNQGEPLSPLDEADALNRLVSWGWDVKKVALKVGKSASHVYGRLKLLEGSAAIQAAVHTGEIGVADALEEIRVAAAPEKKQAKLLAQGEKIRHKLTAQAALHDLLCAAQDVIDARENVRQLHDALDILDKALSNYDTIHGNEPERGE